MNDNKKNDANIESLIPFLRQLANSLERKELCRDQIEKIGNFFLTYKFYEELENNNKINNNEFSKEDMVKFLSLGYYIYTHLLKI